jgi:hypothetical protein
MITDDEAREMRAKAMEQDQLLIGFGHDIYAVSRVPFRDRAQKLKEEREEFLSDEYLDQIRYSAAWISKQRIMKKVNYGATSYGYKHEVEDWSKKIDQYLYVSNGAFIAAALGMGIQSEHCGDDSPNYFFAFSSSDRVREKCLEISS